MLMQGKGSAIYCRVDRGGNFQMRWEALAAQKWLLIQYAKAQGIQIAGFYEDNGFSGHDLNRPGLTQLINDRDSGTFEQVLVVSRDRLYRGSCWEEPQWPFRVYSLNQLEYD